MGIFMCEETEKIFNKRDKEFIVIAICISTILICVMMSFGVWYRINLNQGTYTGLFYLVPLEIIKLMHIGYLVGRYIPYLLNQPKYRGSRVSSYILRKKENRFLAKVIDIFIFLIIGVVIYIVIGIASYYLSLMIINATTIPYYNIPTLISIILYNGIHILDIIFIISMAILLNTLFKGIVPVILSYALLIVKHILYSGKGYILPISMNGVGAMKIKCSMDAYASNRNIFLLYSVIALVIAYIIYQHTSINK